ncbi:hypothetical protein DMB38_12715 [Streptomyces sp. WAC 06738]|uniref:hypothetical protein n=1 Tax=Streptomyces sp. WAC 06738 TaxID=2203210 RepID=UPI000F7123A5|nr:hypothetical protein [Streptomyces sp. WAC 06738]AZM46560.1 hypothetical protein DMB38_12715 [Streptomyces sp. WAC 06738]
MDVNLDAAYWLGLVISVVLPVLVGLVTTRVTHAGVKAVLLLFLSTLNGFLVELASPGPDFEPATAAVLALVSFATGVLTHFGLWKPTGVTAAAQDTLVKDAPRGA